MKKRILHIIGGMNRCGAETFLMNIFRNIDRKKFEFYFLCYDEKEYEYEEEIKELRGIILRIPQLRKVGVKKYIKNLDELMKKYKFEVVHAHTYYNSGIPLMVAKHNKINTRIVHSHTTRSECKSSFIKKIYNIISKIIIDIYANTFIACSKEAGKSLFLKHRKFDVVKNGIDLEKFKFNEEKRKELRETLKIENDEIILGHIGRIEEEKNHVFLINIFNEMLKMKNNYKLLLLGNGNKEQEIKDMCKKYNIEDKVIFLGNVPNVYELINTFDFFVFPSLFEGLGIVLIEAQANGIKCFASTEVPKEADISGNVEYIDLKNGEKKWAEKIYNSNIERKNINFKKCDYNVNNTVEQLTKMYTNDKR